MLRAFSPTTAAPTASRPWPAARRRGPRTLIDLLVDQIEFADVVVINKISDATETLRMEVRNVVAALNPDARQVETDFGRISSTKVLNTGLFDEAKAAAHPLWHKELYTPGPCSGDRGIWRLKFRLSRKASVRSRAVSGIPGRALGGRDSGQGAFLACHASSSRWPHVCCRSAKTL
jgi:G3E family GTPase